jgi:hypothetical protein
MSIGDDSKIVNIRASIIKTTSTDSSRDNNSNSGTAPETAVDPISSVPASIQPPPTSAPIKSTKDDFSLGYLSGEVDLATSQLQEDFDKLQNNFQNLLQTLVAE